jgi:7-keto-8-aminopelargonate synthetase-like enzyme
MPIIPPGVPDRTARLRFFITAHHSADDITTALDMTRATLDDISRPADRVVT